MSSRQLEIMGLVCPPMQGSMKGPTVVDIAQTWLDQHNYEYEHAGVSVITARYASDNSCDCNRCCSLTVLQKSHASVLAIHHQCPHRKTEYQVCSHAAVLGGSVRAVMSTEAMRILPDGSWMSSGPPFKTTSQSPGLLNARTHLPKSTHSKVSGP